MQRRPPSRSTTGNCDVVFCVCAMSAYRRVDGRTLTVHVAEERRRRPQRLRSAETKENRACTHKDPGGIRQAIVGVWLMF